MKNRILELVILPINYL
ncbi:hypothetical protein BDFB_012688 [Asbolus verrucosus]|uniref:Uncharacterized protein n=1 Tax=Asbolus verrucosus TaxID=1661398 RepID=A0A482VD85_ASBVE|nr:hypothetical protein BDFB_012688 [Asbolus verrucosus]